MRHREWHVACTVALLAAGALVACSSDEEDDLPTPAPGFVASCTDSGGAPTAGSVTTACGSPTNLHVPVDVLITDSPAGQEIVAIVVDMTFNPSVTQFLPQACEAGPALGAPSELVVTCAADSNVPGRLVASVSRKGTSPGVAITGTESALRLWFRVGSVGTSPLAFLAPNDPNGSALLRRVGPGAEAIPGITFSSGSALQGQ